MALCSRSLERTCSIGFGSGRLSPSPRKVKPLSLIRRSTQAQQSARRQFGPGAQDIEAAILICPNVVSGAPAVTMAVTGEPISSLACRGTRAVRQQAARHARVRA
jgi:hypothetical protein